MFSFHYPGYDCSPAYGQVPLVSDVYPVPKQPGYKCEGENCGSFQAAVVVEKRMTAGGGRRLGGGGMSKKEKGLMDMDNSVVIAGERRV